MDSKKETKANDFYTKLLASIEKKDNMMTNTDYIEWLIKFTQERGFFSDDQWAYSEEKISDEDKENVESLGLFYEGIDRYASKNFMYPIEKDFGGYYKVKIGDCGFKIGIFCGQGGFTFCERIPVEKEEDFIDFYDIINNKKQDNYDYICNTLKLLSNIIIEAHEAGVPTKAIHDTCNATIKEISNKCVSNEIEGKQKKKSI